MCMRAGVSDTIRQGVADIKQPDCWACGYCDSDMSLYMLGMMCALLSTAAFLLLASYTSMPVSTTHAIVGAVVGFTIVGTKASCLKLSALGYIALSWVASPLLSGAIGSVLYYVLHRTVIQAPGVCVRASLCACAAWVVPPGCAARYKSNHYSDGVIRLGALLRACARLCLQV